MDLHRVCGTAGVAVFGRPGTDFIQSRCDVAGFELGCHIPLHVDQDKGRIWNTQSDCRLWNFRLMLAMTFQLNHNLERCIGQINRHLMRHKIILGLDDRGRISCHKVNLCFIYFDTNDCVVSACYCWDSLCYGFFFRFYHLTMVVEKAARDNRAWRSSWTYSEQGLVAWRPKSFQTVSRKNGHRRSRHHHSGQQHDTCFPQTSELFPSLLILNFANQHLDQMQCVIVYESISCRILMTGDVY